METKIVITSVFTEGFACMHVKLPLTLHTHSTPHFVNLQLSFRVLYRPEEENSLHTGKAKIIVHISSHWKSPSQVKESVLVVEHVRHLWMSLARGSEGGEDTELSGGVETRSKQKRSTVPLLGGGERSRWGCSACWQCIWPDEKFVLKCIFDSCNRTGSVIWYFKARIYL